MSELIRTVAGRGTPLQAFVGTSGPQMRGMLLGLAVLGLLNAAGLCDTVLGTQYRAGELDPLLAPATLVILAAIYAASLIHARLIPEHMLVIVIMLVLGGLSWTIGWRSGTLTKLLRDATYVGILGLVSLNLRTGAGGAGVELKYTAKTLFVGGLGLLPAAGAAVRGLDPSGRLSGFMLSAPLFGNSAVVYLMLGYLVGLPRRWMAFGVVAAGTAVVASGTRTGIVLLAALAGLYMIDRFATVGRRAAVGAATAVLLAAAAIAVGIGAGLHTQLENIRIFSIRDVQYGSIASRLYWYQSVFSALRSTHFFGGYGPGASEMLLGELTHFDLLRYWYDYSIVYLIGFVALLWRVMNGPDGRQASNGWHPHLVTAMLMGVATLLSMHNVFQSAGGTVMVAVLLFSARTHSHRMILRRSHVRDASDVGHILDTSSAPGS